jgi:type IV pilus assembly protein PilE
MESNMKSTYNATLRARSQGVTLIELLIVIVIVGILGTIALSSYRSYVMRANRTEARMTLLAIQTAQEKWFVQNSQYAQDIATLVAAPPAGLGIALSAAGVTPGGSYTISFTAATPTAYTVQAAATGAQAYDTACPTLAIDQNATRTPTTSTCWR